MATKDLRAKPPEMPVKCLEGNTMGTLQTDLPVHCVLWCWANEKGKGSHKRPQKPQL
jgi:hypothetical protein